MLSRQENRNFRSMSSVVEKYNWGGKEAGVAFSEKLLLIFGCLRTVLWGGYLF
jgi:hypothetical protein